MMKSKHSSKHVQLVVLEFFDDADFCTKGADSGSKMKEIVDYYSSMCEATEGKVQKEKVVIISCKWEINQIVEVAIKVIATREIIKSMHV